MWPMELIATTTIPAKPTPATATLCLFMGTGTRFACKIRLLPSVSEVPLQRVIPCNSRSIGSFSADD
jgi:hypothetical protein